MQEFHIFTCKSLNNNEEKLDISDNEALTAYRDFYEGIEKFNSDSNTTFYKNHLNHLADLEGKDITYSEYLNTSKKPFDPNLWGLQLTPDKDWIWYMNKEIKDDLIKCAEKDKEIKQRQLEFLTSDEYPTSPSQNVISNLTAQINSCDKIIDNLNYYYDRRMLLFFIF